MKIMKNPTLSAAMLIPSIMTGLSSIGVVGVGGHLPFLTEGDAAKSKMPEIGFCPARRSIRSRMHPSSRMPSWP
jgi:hypothetical protein